MIAPVPVHCFSITLLAGRIHFTNSDTFSEFLLIFQWYWCVSSLSSVLIARIWALGITLSSSAIANFHSNDREISVMVIRRHLEAIQLQLFEKINTQKRVDAYIKIGQVLRNTEIIILNKIYNFSKQKIRR